MPILDRGWVALPLCGASLCLKSLTWKWWPKLADTHTSHHTLRPGGFWCWAGSENALRRYEIDAETGLPALVAAVANDSFSPKADLTFRRPLGTWRKRGLLILRVGSVAWVLDGEDGSLLRQVELPRRRGPNQKSQPFDWLVSVDARGSVVLAGKQRVWREKRPDRLCELAALACRAYGLEKVARGHLPEETRDIFRRYPPKACCFV